MFNRTALLAAAASVTLGLTGSAMAQSTSYETTTVKTESTMTRPQTNENSHTWSNAQNAGDRTGATDSLGQKYNASRSDNQLKQPAVWKGQRAPNQLVNVGNALPERTAFGRVGDIDNSNTGALNRLPSGEVIIEREAVIASERFEPAPVIESDTTVRDTKVVETGTTDGIDSRFLKPADPAVVTPDYKANAGIDRTLAQDKNIYGRGQRMDEYRSADSELALKDISNHPIDSLNDPRFKSPVMPEDTMGAAQPASERIQPDTYVAPAEVTPSTQPSTYVPVVPVAPARPDEFQSTWSSQSDRLEKDDAVRRPLRTPDKDQPAPMKGERALNALDNTRNPVPDKTVFGKTGDIRSNGPVNNAGEPLVQPTNP